jgi:TPR repeat protein
MAVAITPHESRDSAPGWCRLFLAGLLVIPGLAAAGITECDRLAGHPSDPDKVVPGVSSEQVRGWNDAAIWACREAVKTEPGNWRVRYQLGRTLFYDGQKAEALEHLAVAAAARHRQAQFVLGLMYTDGVENVRSADPCKALELWSDAAGRDHFAARVALGRDYVRGTYASCEPQPDRAQVDSWLRSARSETRDYYQQLLIDWTREVLDAGN